jgi:hypothetical protein
MKRFITLVSLGVLAAVPAHSQDHHRQLGAHEHGRGFLNIAVEGNRVSMEFQAPGSDIARSETKPNTPERKAMVEAAIATLEKPLELFRPAAEAGCTVVAAKARMTIIGESDGKGHGGAKHDGGSHGHAKQAKDEKHGHGHKAGEDHRGHSDYHGSYELTCTAPARLTSFELPYFKAFPRAQKLTVQIIGPKGQTRAEATAAKPTVSLSGSM